MGLIIATGGSAIGHLYVMMFKMHEKSELAAAVKFREVAELVQRLATAVEKDRDIVTDARMKMVTRQDLRDQTDQLLHEIDRRVAWTKDPRHRPLNS